MRGSDSAMSIDNATKRHVHFVGAGGIGMSGLAEILLNLGYRVSGSDLHGSSITRRLAALGMTFHEGHAAGNIEDASIIVRSAAIPDDNVELTAAKHRGIPIIHRSRLLADLMRLKPNAVAVGGTHGKTTTTSMISAILDHAHLDATTIVGGILHRSGTNASWGRGDTIVAETDEHDGSFLDLSPTIAVVTNIDAEHLEYYGTLDNIRRAFADFCNRIPFYGFAIVCQDDPEAASIVPSIESVCLTYGVTPGASLTAENIVLDAPAGPQAQRLKALHTQFDVVSRDERLGQTGRLGKVRLNALGAHNVANALAACTVGLCLGIPFETLAGGIAAYDGVRRRLQVCGETRGITVVEDYAHHPTELRCTLEAVRLLEPRRMICIFQPHLYSRTKFFHREFASVLASADLAYVTGIYAAREQPIAGVDSGLIVDAARLEGATHVSLIEHPAEVSRAVAAEARPGDLILILGAGDINQIAGPMLEAMEALP